MLILWIVFATMGGYFVGSTWFSEHLVLSTSLGFALGVMTALLAKYGGGSDGGWDFSDFSSDDGGGCSSD